MDRKELKREIIQMYANCGSYILQCGTSEKDGCFTTRFKHPTQDKIIEITEDTERVLCVLVYRMSKNAARRNCVECKTLSELKKAVS